MELCLKTIIAEHSKNKALTYAIHTGTLGIVKLLMESGADLHLQTYNLLTSRETSLLNYAIACGRFDMACFLMDKGIEPSDASLSFLLIFCSRHSDWYLIATDRRGDRKQELSAGHLNILTLSRQLLSRRPELIYENWDGLPTPIEEAVRGGLLCQVVNLIQYGADLSGMEKLTLSVIQEKERLNYPKLWNYYAILFSILHVSVALHAFPIFDSKNSLLEIASVYLQQRLACPFRLQELCRAKIVQQMKGHAWLSVPHLGLPIALQKYIRYEGLIDHLHQICTCQKQDLGQDQCLCQSVYIKCLDSCDDERIALIKQTLHSFI